MKASLSDNWLLLNAPPSIFITLFGMITLVILLSIKAIALMALTPSDIITLVSWLFLNAPQPMVVTLLGIITLVNLLE